VSGDEGQHLLGKPGDGNRFTGAACDLPPTGTATLTLPDQRLAAGSATDGLATDRQLLPPPDGSGARLPGAGLVCPGITRHVTNNGAPSEARGRK